MAWEPVSLREPLSSVIKDSKFRVASMKSFYAALQSSHLGVIAKLALTGLFIGLVIFVFSQWNTFVVTIVEWQKALHTMLASHIHAVSENVLKYGGALIALSFGYGVFHALGPGHGKAVIVTYLGTHKESMWKGIVISLSAAILQSVIAIVLVSALARMLKFKLSDVHSYGNDMALVSYILVILLGMSLVVSSVRRLVKLRRSRALADQEVSSHHQAHVHSHSEKHSHQDHSHSHENGCGCSHAHAPEKNQSVWKTMTVILSMGFRPCSGAIVVLIYAHLVGVYFYGVIATLMMGIGTGLSVSMIAVGVQYARSWLERFATESSELSFYSVLSMSHYVRLIGGIILILLGVNFYSAASVIVSNHPLF